MAGHWWAGGGFRKQENLPRRPVLGTARRGRLCTHGQNLKSFYRGFKGQMGSVIHYSLKAPSMGTMGGAYIPRTAEEGQGPSVARGHLAGQPDSSNLSSVTHLLQQCSLSQRWNTVKCPFLSFSCDVSSLLPKSGWVLEKILARSTSGAPVSSAGPSEWGLNSIDLDSRKRVIKNDC